MVKFVLCRPSLLWGFLPSKGVGWRWAAPGCAFLGVVVSSKGGRCFRRHSTQVVSPALAPTLLGEPSQFVGGWLTGGVAARGGWMQFGSCEPGKQVVRCSFHGRSVESTLYVVLCFSIHSLAVCESSCNLILECQDYVLYWAMLLSINEMK